MTSSKGFPAADAEKELNPGMNEDFQIDPISSDIATTEVKEPNPNMNTDFQVDPISSNIATTKEMEAQHDAEKLEEQEKKEALQSFERALTVSGIIVAVIGAVFAITKKLREK